MRKTRRLFASLCATGLLAVGVAAPASAQPVVTGGLVNVTLTNVLNDNTVQVAVPINAAVAVCANVDVTAAVLLAAINAPGVQTIDCRARGNQDVTITA